MSSNLTKTGKKDRRKTIDLGIINSFVSEQHNGACLSLEYEGAHKNLLFQCELKHEWEATWSNIKNGKWCPQCRVFVGERITKLFFESIFDKKFPKCRPDWLVGKHGKKLELDGYCSELGIAFEHNGKQHFEIVPSWNKTADDLEKQKSNDAHKAKLCKENGVKLIIIPQVPEIIKIEKLKDFIVERCNLLSINIEKNIDNLIINPKLEPISLEYLKKYQTIAKNKGGKCLSTTYLNNSEELLFECKEGHEWAAVPSNIRSGAWCPICYGIKHSGSDYEHTSEYFLKKYQNIAASKGGKCLSEIYINNSSKLTFECKNKHQWRSFPYNIFEGSWCNECYLLNIKTEKIKIVINTELSYIDRYKDIANQHDGKCISNEYKNNQTELSFICKMGHTWDAKPINILHGSWCKKCHYINCSRAGDQK